jgi:hypothetical protein
MDINYDGSDPEEDYTEESNAESDAELN